jgi:hypothetical protein
MSHTPATWQAEYASAIDPDTDLATATTPVPSAGVALTGDQALSYAIDGLAVSDARYANVPRDGTLLSRLPVIFGSDSEMATLQLIQASAISFASSIYASIPIIRPYAIRDRSKRGSGGGAEQWGVPNVNGYFSDDNSLIKRLPQMLDIQSQNQYFNGRRVTGGWTCCHAWRRLDSGKQASSYGSLNSFTPLLTWVPTPLARSTDKEDSAPQKLLKGYAYSFKDVVVPKPMQSYVDRCWELVGEDTEPQVFCASHEFAYSEKFVKDRVKSIRKVSYALADLTRKPTTKTLSTRYASGILALDPHRARLLAEALENYADNIEQAVNGRIESSYKQFPE